MTRQVSQYEGERFSVVYFRSHGKFDAPLCAVHLPLEEMAVGGAMHLHVGRGEAGEGKEEEERKQQGDKVGRVLPIEEVLEK